MVRQASRGKSFRVCKASKDGDFGRSSARGVRGRSRRGRKGPEDLEKMNSHINFEREGKKTNARKWDTKVTCVDCGINFTLPFKPRKPEVYCDACFKKRGKGKGKGKHRREQGADSGNERVGSRKNRVRKPLSVKDKRVKSSGNYASSKFCPR